MARQIRRARTPAAGPHTHPSPATKSSSSRTEARESLAMTVSVR